MDETADNSQKLAADARREARIRKVLGNSKNRLSKITGNVETANGKNLYFDFLACHSSKIMNS